MINNPDVPHFEQRTTNPTPQPIIKPEDLALRLATRTAIVVANSATSAALTAGQVALSAAVNVGARVMNPPANHYRILGSLGTLMLPAVARITDFSDNLLDATLENAGNALLQLAQEEPEANEAAATVNQNNSLLATAGSVVTAGASLAQRIAHPPENHRRWIRSAGSALAPYTLNPVVNTLDNLISAGIEQAEAQVVNHVVQPILTAYNQTVQNIISSTNMLGSVLGRRNIAAVVHEPEVIDLTQDSDDEDDLLPADVTIKTEQEQEPEDSHTVKKNRREL
jgi:hypothetical protein